MTSIRTGVARDVLWNDAMESLDEDDDRVEFVDMLSSARVNNSSCACDPNDTDLVLFDFFSVVAGGSSDELDFRHVFSTVGASSSSSSSDSSASTTGC